VESLENVAECLAFSLCFLYGIFFLYYISCLKHFNFSCITHCIWWFYLFIFCGNWVWTQGLKLGRKAFWTLETFCLCMMVIFSFGTWVDRMLRCEKQKEFLKEVNCLIHRWNKNINMKESPHVNEYTICHFLGISLMSSTCASRGDQRMDYLDIPYHFTLCLSLRRILVVFTFWILN
jgi:hypothetical protein